MNILDGIYDKLPMKKMMLIPTSGIGCVFLLFGLACSDKNNAKEIDNSFIQIEQDKSFSAEQCLEIAGKVYHDKNEIEYLKGYQECCAAIIENTDFKYGYATYYKNNELLVLFKEIINIAGSDKVYFKILKGLKINTKQKSFWCCCFTKSILAIGHMENGKGIIDLAWQIKATKSKILLEKIDTSKIELTESEIECGLEYKE